jgi:hypothetical protein
MSTPTVKRPRGRPPLPEQERMIVRNIRLPRELWEKVDAAGGAEWLRALIKRARLPNKE